MSWRKCYQQQGGFTACVKRKAPLIWFRVFSIWRSCIVLRPIYLILIATKPVTSPKSCSLVNCHGWHQLPFRELGVKTYNGTTLSVPKRCIERTKYIFDNHQCLCLGKTFQHWHDVLSVAMQIQDPFPDWWRILFNVSGGLIQRTTAAILYVSYRNVHVFFTLQFSHARGIKCPHAEYICYRHVPYISSQYNRHAKLNRSFCARQEYLLYL